MSELHCEAGTKTETEEEKEGRLPRLQEGRQIEAQLSKTFCGLLE